jgi:hypothetical protein
VHGPDCDHEAAEATPVKKAKKETPKAEPEAEEKPTKSPKAKTPAVEEKPKAKKSTGAKR